MHVPCFVANRVHCLYQTAHLACIKLRAHSVQVTTTEVCLAFLDVPPMTATKRRLYDSSGAGVVWLPHATPRLAPLHSKSREVPAAEQVTAGQAAGGSSGGSASCRWQ